jgi:hypothetical protein
MKDVRFHPPKCRGKVQKMEVLYMHPPKEAQALATCKVIKK